MIRGLLPFREQYLAFRPNVVDHYRPRQIEEALARVKRIEKLMAPDDPMLFVRPRRQRREGAGLN
jgi:hypothetical protein